MNTYTQEQVQTLIKEIIQQFGFLPDTSHKNIHDLFDCVQDIGETMDFPITIFEQDEQILYNNQTGIVLYELQ